MEKLKESVGQRIKQLRKRKNLTQEKLAELIDICPRQVSRLECGGNFPSFTTFEKLSEALDVKTIEFFNFDNINIKKVQNTDKKSS